jgi:hypothetical protein
MLVEKAWAKVQGSYGKTVGTGGPDPHGIGNPGQMMEALTGKSSTTTKTDDVVADVALKTLSAALKAGHPVTASSRGEYIDARGRPATGLSAGFDVVETATNAEHVQRVGSGCEVHAGEWMFKVEAISVDDRTVTVRATKSRAWPSDRASTR